MLYQSNADIFMAFLKIEKSIFFLLPRSLACTGMVSTEVTMGLSSAFLRVALIMSPATQSPAQMAQTQKRRSRRERPSTTYLREPFN